MNRQASWQGRLLRHRFQQGLLCLLALLWVTALEAAPLAKQGEIDLRALDVAHDAMAELNGAWTFYWHRLLTPEDFAQGKSLPEPSGLQVPQAWRKAKLPGNERPGQGYGTYRLRVLPPQGEQELALRIPEISSAYVLWVDGRMLVHTGTVGTDVASERIGSSEIRIVRFASHGTPVEILLQTSSQKHTNGGLTAAIQLAAPGALLRPQIRQWGAGLAVAGALLVMAIYHLALFISRRSNPAPLLLCIYCLLRTTNTLCSSASDEVVWLLFPEANGELISTLGMACLLGSLPFLQAFFTSLFPVEFPRKWMLVLATTGMLFTGFGVLTGFDLAGMLLMAAYMAVVVVYSIFSLIRAWRAKRVGALLLLMGYVLLGLSGLNDFLDGYNIIHTMRLASIGTLGFILCQTFALAHRFSMAFTAVENLSDQLEERNANLQDEMAERARLEQDLERISDEERRVISRALHDGLCQDLTAARLHCSLLEPSESNPQVSQTELDQLSALLEHAVNQAYELSRGLWPMESDAQNLAGALQELGHKTRTLHRLALTVHCENACLACSSQIAANIYHIAKEALQNIVKHAKARNVSVVLECIPGAENLSLRIEDDGVGLGAAKASPGGLGTRIMMHRAKLMGGKLTISERTDGGTVVCLSIPRATQDCVSKAAHAIRLVGETVPAAGV